jgi:hypothetical protein
MNPNPGCELDCRFTYGVTTTTCAYYPPVYDKHGNNLNPDLNVTSGSVRCSVCDKEWNYSTRCGETTFSELRNETA